MTSPNFFGTLEQASSDVAWESSIHSSATPAILDKLFSGQIAGICVLGFLTKKECEELSQRAEELEFKDYLNVTPRIGRVGITVFEYDSIGKPSYFGAVQQINHRIAQLANGICNPLERVMDWLKTMSPRAQVGIAHEQDFGPYFAGLFRRIEEGTLIHVDFAPAEHPNWGVSQVTAQLAFNIYIKCPDVEPGVVDIWQKQWESQDERQRIPGSYGYLPNIIENVPSAAIVPQSGMLMVINTRHFHQVSPAAGVRIAISAAIGRMPNGDIVLWS
jgi:Carrier-protein-independent halogenase WelO5